MAKKRKRVVERKEVIVSLPVIKAPRWLQGFVNFVREQGVVGLAVGFVLGVAAKGVVDAIVNNLINPIVGVLYGGGQLADKFWCLKRVGAECSNKFGYGAVSSQLINFLIVAGVVYFIVKGLKLDKIDKPKDTDK